MSDFLFSTQPMVNGQLTRIMQSIYRDGAPAVKEYHGKWGSLAVSENIFIGFSPVETEQHICLIIGAPVLTFTSNRFLAGGDRTHGTRQILDKWNSSGGLKWDEDLSGPFVAMLVDKLTNSLQVVTDLMSFIPVYVAKHEGVTIIGTHVDMVAKGAECQNEKDAISIADFIEHGNVTFPYTFYQSVKQLKPANKYIWHLKSEVSCQSNCYWKPTELNPYKSVEQAADALREGLSKYINNVTEGMEEVALFISGGEDSRTILSLLPKRLNKDAIVFLDKMNREGRIAKAAAESFDANFVMGLRTGTRYLEVLPQCSDLVGSGSQYTHVHTYGFHHSCKLGQYKAVFGGLLSDALLKGSHIKKIKYGGRVPFVPMIKQPDYSHANPLKIDYFRSMVIDSLNERRISHYNWINEMRPQSVDEWFELWPSSMNFNIPNFHGNRRLFRSYEPFMSHDVVKISAAVPQNWKLNRRLFHCMAKSLLEPTKHLPHSDGWLPYYSWLQNSFIRGVPWVLTKIFLKIRATKRNEGPWCDWEAVMNGDMWKDIIRRYIIMTKEKETILQDMLIIDVEQLLTEKRLKTSQKINLLQVLYHLYDEN